MSETVVRVVGIVLLVALLLFALDRLALWMEARGWLYWRRTKKRTGGSIGNALLEVHQILEPGKRHVLEVRRREDSDDDESGDPPEPGISPGKGGT